MPRLFGFNTGRGHRRARIIAFHRAQGGTAWGAVLTMIIPSFR
jgi:hypothetical protein